MKGRKLVHFTTGTQWDPKIHIGFVDYTGHQAKHRGQHFTAKHDLRVTEEELYEILKPYLETLHGNEPDMVQCGGCGSIVFSDEVDWDTDDEFPTSCPNCKG